MSNWARGFRSFLFLCILFVFASNVFAQTNLETFAQIVNRGTTEQKRDALLQIRNLEMAEASRLAIPLLRDSSEIVRATAAFSVIFLSEDEALQALLPLLKDKSALVRRETAYALGRVRNPAAVNPLLQTFQKDKISEVKNACIVALGAIGDASAIDALTLILRRKPQTKEEFLRRSAARSIGQIAQIILTDKAKVLTPENFLPEKYDQLEKPKYPRLIENFPAFRAAINVLVQALQNPREFSDVKREAAFALGAIGDESAIPVLQANLKSEDYYLTEIAREALQKIFFLSEQKNGINNSPSGFNQ